MCNVLKLGGKLTASQQQHLPRLGVSRSEKQAGIKWGLGFLPTKSRLGYRMDESMAENIITSWRSWLLNLVQHLLNCNFSRFSYVAECHRQSRDAVSKMTINTQDSNSSFVQGEASDSGAEGHLLRRQHFNKHPRFLFNKLFEKTVLSKSGWTKKAVNLFNDFGNNFQWSVIKNNFQLFILSINNKSWWLIAYEKHIAQTSKNLKTRLKNLISSLDFWPPADKWLCLACHFNSKQFRSF